MAELFFVHAGTKSFCLEAFLRKVDKVLIIDTNEIFSAHALGFAFDKPCAIQEFIRHLLYALFPKHLQRAEECPQDFPAARFHRLAPPPLQTALYPVVATILSARTARSIL